MNLWDEIMEENAADARATAIDEGRAVPDDDRYECSRCDGTGEAEYEGIPGVHEGIGAVFFDRCHRCRGTGIAP